MLAERIHIRQLACFAYLISRMARPSMPPIAISRASGTIPSMSIRIEIRFKRQVGGSNVVLLACGRPQMNRALA
jgi:hypothetical protein